MAKRNHLIVLGRLMGTCTGWDQQDTALFFFYGFKPAAGIEVPAGDIDIDYVAGKIRTYDESGETVTGTFDVIEALSKAGKASPVSKR